MAARADLFITGVTGSIGRQLAGAALQQGYRVRGLALPGEDTRTLEEHGVDVRRGRMEEPASLEAASEGTSHAAHCAALLPHLAQLGREAFQRVNVEGARAMAILAERRGWKRVVFLSTCGVLGRERSGPTTDETAYRDPYDLYTWSKIQAEKAVLEEVRQRGIPAVVLRPANVYGTGMSFKWPELFQLVRDGKMKLIDGGRAPFCVIHVRDLVRAVLLALEETRVVPPGERILISSGEELTFAGVIDAVATALGAAPPGNVPYALALGAALVARALPPPLRLGRLKLLTPAAVREYRQGFRFDTAHAERVLGFRAQEGFAPGTAEAAAAWRAAS
jgi:nucleoside-diphosphate-sugar epimerase